MFDYQVDLVQTHDTNNLLHLRSTNQPGTYVPSPIIIFQNRFLPWSRQNSDRAFCNQNPITTRRRRSTHASVHLFPTKSVIMGVGNKRTLVKTRRKTRFEPFSPLPPCNVPLVALIQLTSFRHAETSIRSRPICSHRNISPSTKIQRPRRTSPGWAATTVLSVRSGSKPKPILLLTVVASPISGGTSDNHNQSLGGRL